MKLRKLTASLLAALILVGVLTGCGAASKDNYAGMDEQNQMEMETQAAFDPEEMGGMGELPYPDQKLIKTVSIDGETEDMDQLLQSLNERIRQVGGYVENQNLYNGSAYRGGGYRSLSMTIRIPAEKLGDFLGSVSEVTNVVSRNETVDEVTQTYVAVESRITALKTEQTRLLELLEKAETMSDLLEIEARLTDVRYELENYTSQMLHLDNKIAYSTVELSVTEVVEYTPSEEQTVWQRISGGFLDSLKGLGSGIVEIFVFLIVKLPYLLVLGGIAAAVTIPIVRSSRKKKKQHNPPENPQTKA